MKKGYKSLQRLDYRRDNRKFIYTRGINKDKDVENIKQCLDELDEYKRKEHKYRWHDLRKNPNDLPKKGYLVVHFYKNLDSNLLSYDVGHIKPNDKKEYISWKYIEDFEDE